ncbi:MAG: thiamine phosphate synthase [Planctomycetota bacterium]|nr:thiamine phosphate synthase [Planctomycetota bacterium]
MSSIARILDANANRAREALRMMEDAARFSLNDAKLSQALKTLRHDFHSALAMLPPGWLEANRDTPGDVGTENTTPQEYHRDSLEGVVIASGKRLGEALRVIEETGKTINPRIAARIEAIRYRGYELEAELHKRMGSGRAKQWRVCVLLTESICLKPWREVLEAVIDAGADCIQVREKTMEGKALAERVREVISLARPKGVSVIVNDRVDVALATGADGVHVGQNDLSVAEVRRLAGRMLLVGVSTHDLEEADAAIEAGADYCGVGAMFATSLKPERTPSGPAYLASIIERYPDTPHLAIGGITPCHVEQLMEAGCQGVAVSTAVCGADDPGAAVNQMKELMSTQDSGVPSHPVK